MVMLNSVPEITSGPCVTRLQLLMAVGVMVGVRDEVGVREGVGVLLGVKVKDGVVVGDGVRELVAVWVTGVKVRDGVREKVGVTDAEGVIVMVDDGVPVFTPLMVDGDVTSMEMLNNTVRELRETIQRWAKGTNLDTIGVYSSRTSTLTRWLLSLRMAAVRLLSVEPVQYAVGVLSAGPSSHVILIWSKVAT